MITILAIRSGIPPAVWEEMEPAYLATAIELLVEEQEEMEG